MIVKLKEELGEEKGVFTHADVKHITPDNMAICDMLICEETIQEDGSVLIAETYREGNASFNDGNWMFELSEEQLDELSPVQPEMSEDLP